MNPRPSLIQRAYELARSCSSMAQMTKRLTEEGYVNVHPQLASPGLRRELRAAMRQYRRGAAQGVSQ